MLVLECILLQEKDSRLKLECEVYTKRFSEIIELLKKRNAQLLMEQKIQCDETVLTSEDKRM